MSNAVIVDVPVTMPVTTPHTVGMHERDNVVIVANDGGLPPGWRCAIVCRKATRSRW